MPRWVAGVDGCKTGWIVALRDLDAPHAVRVRVEPTLAAVVDGPEQPSIVAIDMPIGLPQQVGRGGRTADQLARASLGQRRGTVFPTSARSVVYAESYAAAIALSRSPATQPFAPSPPAFAIFPRIREIDRLLRARPELIPRVIEAHPEMAFWAMNGDAPVLEPKTTVEGLRVRRRLLQEAGIPASVVNHMPPRGAAKDDLPDALAALIVAQDVARGRARSLPHPPETDEHGLPVAIWIPGPMPTVIAAAAPAPSPPVSRDDIRAAHQRIAPHVRRTPVWRLPARSFGHDGPVSLKLELLQHAGSFKPRGAFNTLLSQPIPRTGVAAASGGNHGAAVAYAARCLGLKARIFVPEISSPAKIAVIRAHGAEVVVGGARYADAQEACDRYVGETGALRVHPFDAETTMAGQGTVALEWEADDADLDTALIAVGGGGLIAGVAAWWAGRVKVIGVEPHGSRALHAALQAGAPVDVEVNSVAADSLGARNVGERVFAVCRDSVNRVVLVSDEAIVAAQRALWRDWRIAAEPGGAAALAALLSGAYRPRAGERVGVLLCGANVDLTKLAEIAA
jgi:threonine dehydratase